MIVTDKEYSIENRMIPFLNKIALRVSKPTPKLDYALLIDGYEGYGKSNIGVGYAYYLAEKTKRKFDLNNVIFTSKDMLNQAIKTENNILMMDECALSLLAEERGKKAQIDIIKMLNVARKKRHLFIFCIPRFYRLKEPIIERCMGLIHVYAKNENEFFRFRFYKHSQLNSLWENFKKNRRRPNYAKNFACRGGFCEMLPKVLDEVAYDKKKDEAMMTILNEEPKEKTLKDKKLDKFKRFFGDYLYKKKLGADFSRFSGVTVQSICAWRKIKVDNSLPLGGRDIIDEGEPEEPEASEELEED